MAYVPSASTLGLPAPPPVLPAVSSPPNSLLSWKPPSAALASAAKIGISPMSLRISASVFSISPSSSMYSPRIHRTPRKTLPVRILESVLVSFSVIAGRSAGNFSTTSLPIDGAQLAMDVVTQTKQKTNRTNATTSNAEGLFESPRNSINAWTTLAATSENLTARTCMLWIRS